MLSPVPAANHVHRCQFCHHSNAIKKPGSAASYLHTCVSLTGCAFADETISSRAAGMPYVSQYIQKYAEHIMQLPDDTGRVPSLNLPISCLSSSTSAGECKLWSVPITCYSMHTCDHLQT